MIVSCGVKFVGSVRGLCGITGRVESGKRLDKGELKKRVLTAIYTNPCKAVLPESFQARGVGWRGLSGMISYTKRRTNLSTISLNGNMAFTKLAALFAGSNLCLSRT